MLPRFLLLKAGSVVGCLVLICTITHGQTTIALWTFEATAPTATDSQTIGPIAPEVGNGIGRGWHADDQTDWSSPSGNGSSKSLSANRWSIDDYFEFEVSTLGLSDIQVSWDMRRSNTGPERFRLQWSNNGTDWETLPAVIHVADSDWKTTTRLDSSFYLFSLPDGAEDSNQLILRLMAEAVSSSWQGTAVIDNVSVVSIPEPSSFAIISSVGALIFVALTRFRRKRPSAAQGSGIG